MNAAHRIVSLIALTCTVTLAAPGLLYGQGQPEEGWVELFNGKDLDGWKFHLGKDGVENEGTFSVRDGTLVCSGKPSGYIYTPKSYSNYILRFELAFNRPDGLENDAAFGGNSGCLIHVADENALGIWPRSVEVQGMNRQLGLILPIPRSLTCTRTFDEKASAKVRRPVGEFNQVEVDVRGGEMVITLNGSVVSTVSGCELTNGPIGFQSEGAETHWRNIRILPR